MKDKTNATSTHFRWVIVSLLFLISMLNYVDRASMGFAITLIAKDFQFSQQDIGLILSAFGLGYIFSTFLGGIAADKIGAKKTLSISTLLWSFSILCLGFTSNFYVFVTLRVLFGLSEGPNFPCVTRAISDWLPEDERARAFTFSLVAVPISLGLGGLLVSYIISMIGWRACFFVLSALTLLWLPLWQMLFTNKPHDSKHVNAQEIQTIEATSTLKDVISLGKSPWKALCSNKTLLSNNFGFFVFGFYLNFFMNWLPTYLMEVQHIPFKELGYYALMPWALAALLLWVIGILSDKIFQKTKNLRYARTYPIIVTQALAVVFMISINFTQDLNWIIAFISGGVGFAMSSNAPFYAVNVDVAKKRAATSLGLMTLCFSISSIIAPALSGYIVQLTGSFADVFYFMAGLGVLSIILMFCYHNRSSSSCIGTIYGRNENTAEQH